MIIAVRPSVADLDGLRAEARRTILDIRVEAANAYLILQERRRTAALLDEQIAFARDAVGAANARYASDTAPQPDVLRAKVEVARLEAALEPSAARYWGAEAMLNASLALDADTPVPVLAPLTFTQAPPSWAAIRSALATRPEITRLAVSLEAPSAQNDMREFVPNRADGRRLRAFR